MFLSEMGYSELVQRLFEKMTFFGPPKCTPSHLSMNYGMRVHP